jgi:quercetin dioxygenase-like cupin family protein
VAADAPTEVHDVTRAADRRDVFTPHHGLRRVDISGDYAQFRGTAAVATIEAGADSGEKPLSHPGEEPVLVTEGALVFEIAATSFELGPGDWLHFIGDQPHHWVNETAKPAGALWFALRDS